MTGVTSDQSAIREARAAAVSPGGTATCTPPVRSDTSASGERAWPTVSSRQPRRAASAASPSGPGARPDIETATTRSSGPTQPGSGKPRRTDTGTGELLPASNVSTSPTTADPPRLATTTARGRPSDTIRAVPASAVAVSAIRTWAPAIASARRLPDGSAATRPSASSRSCSSRAISGPRTSLVDQQDRNPVVNAVGEGAPGALQLRAPLRALLVDQGGMARGAAQDLAQPGFDGGHGPILTYPRPAQRPGPARAPRHECVPSPPGRWPRRSAGAAVRCCSGAG